MKLAKFALIFVLLALPALAMADGKRVETPYKPQKVVFDFYFDHPLKINSALYWLRTLINTLSDDPYSIPAEANTIVVVLHGTEIATVATKNYEKYQDAVERMRYYSDMGVVFKVCHLGAKDFGYEIADFQDFIEVVPSAMNELAHWQNQGYALITPVIYEKRFSTEELR